MIAIRYTTILFFSLIALSIQTAHATNDPQPKTRWMGMDLSHTLTSPLSTSASTEKTIANTPYNDRYITTLLIDNSSPNIHSKSLNNNSRQQAWLTIKHDHELTSNIHVPVTDALLNRSRQLLAILDTKQASMSQAVKDATFNTKDALISIIMPGGLLYASHRKLAHSQAKEQLTQVANERDELATDIVMLQSISGPVALAMMD